MRVRAIFLIFILSLMLSGYASHAYAARSALFLSPGAGSFFVGSTFDVSIILNTRGEAINTVETELEFPRDTLQIANPSIGKSIIQVWATPPTFSNREGRIYFVGGVPSPGIETSNGVVLTMTFRVIAPGEGVIRFGPRTRVLANDGAGTNTLGQTSFASFDFKPVPPQGPAVSSPTHPDQTQFYKDPNPTVVWEKNAGVTDFSYSIDQDPNGVPDTVSNGNTSSVSFENRKDGIWYFHIRARKAGVWGGTSTFVIRIDTQPPAVFDVKISPAKRTTEERPVARFFTTDSLSGFDHYEIKIVPLAIDANPDAAFFFEATSPYQLTPLKVGRYAVIVRAFDKAGNWQDAEATIAIVRSLFPFVTSEGIDLVFVFIPWSRLLNILLVLFLILIIALVGFWRMHKKHIHHSLYEDVMLILRKRKNSP